jgi:hypothetical protein
MMAYYQPCASATEGRNMSSTATHGNKIIQPAKPHTEHVHGCSTYQLGKGPAALAVTLKGQLTYLKMAN